MKQIGLFDSQRGELEKKAGMKAAADAKKSYLERARWGAFLIARRGDGTCNMDQVAEYLAFLGISPEDLGNAAGSVFKGKEWVFTGRRIKSARVSSHAREIKIWRLK